MLACFHHRVSLCDAQVDSCCIDGFLALSSRLVFPGKLKVLLEEANTLLDESLLVVQETELQCSICLSLGLVLCLSNVHKLTQVVDSHLYVATLSMDVSEKLVGFTLFVPRTSLELSLAHL